MNYLNTRSRGHSHDVDELTNKLARQMLQLRYRYAILVFHSYY